MPASRIERSMLSIRATRQSLLIGGDKTGNDRWYEVYVPIADKLYDAHLEQLRKEKKNG